MRRLHRVTLRATGLITAPFIPVGVWYYYAVKDRHARSEDVRTRVRLPNVQTVDDLMIEKCKPGDVILFDRRWEKCAAGPIAALACLINRNFVCEDDGSAIVTGNFDHCGIIVPGYAKNKQEELDPSNLLLLEATASEGIVARPLLTRLEMSQSRSVMLLPLASPGETRDINKTTDRFVLSKHSMQARDFLDRQLVSFRDKWCDLSEKQGYKNAHSTLTLAGVLMYASGLHQLLLSSNLLSIVPPVSPSAWLVMMALNAGRAGQSVNDNDDLISVKVEDFLRDHRFHEQNSIRLRPGWRFLAPTPMRET